jgi:hypothetical protein
MNDRKYLVKVGLFVVLFSWLIYMVYWFIKGLSWIPLSVNYTFLIDFLTEGAGTLGFIFRIGVVSLAILALVAFLKNKEISKVMKFVSVALVLEALYFLCFIPSAILGFQAGLGLAGGHSLISGESGGLWFFIETAIPTLAEAIIMPISLLKLRSKLTPDAKFSKGTFKWITVVGVCYFIVFWLTYFTQWIATIIQPESLASDPNYGFVGYGINYILQYPVNMFTFLLTAVGLPLLAVFFVRSMQPAMQDAEAPLDLRKIGITLTLLGGYFIIIIALFGIFGYVGGASIWIVFFMFNSADLWCVALPALGIPLILLKKTSGQPS